MLKNPGKKVSFNSSEVSKPNPSSRNKKRVITLFWIFRLPKEARFSPEKFLRRLGAKMVKVLRYVSLRKRSSSSSQKTVSGSNFNRSHSVSAGSMESHRAEAIGDCIEFFNSSSSSSNSTSSIPKSDSVSGKR